MAPTTGIKFYDNSIQKKDIFADDLDGDEISRVLYQFQPIPKFILVSSSSGAAKSPLPPSPTNNNNSSSGTTTASPSSKRFSSVQYWSGSGGGILKLSYQLNPSTLVEFEVTAKKPYLVGCVNHIGNDGIQKQLINLCNQLSSLSTSTAEGAEISLAGILTRLLSALNSNKLTSGQQLSTPTTQTTLIQQQIRQASEETRRIWDLQLLLLRCAAIGRERQTFCSPIPNEYRKYKHRSAEAVWNVSESLCVERLLQPTNKSLTLEEQEFMGYLMSLPWGRHGTLTSSKNNHNNQSTSGGRALRRDFATLEMTLDLEPALGDPSPRFTKLAAQRGTTKVYHGTKTECTWSVLNCGLWNFSDTKFCKHGSLFGKGVYFSTNYKVAYTFAGNGSFAGGGTTVCSERTFHKAWRHWSILRVLQLNNNNNNHNILQDYDIRCFPVFEAQIISPPSEESSYDDDDNNKNVMATRKDGNYYVVPNSRDIRVTKLHLTFELVQKKSFPFVWFGIMLFCILAIRQTTLYQQSTS